MKLFSVFDKKAGTYGPVITQANQVIAIRFFERVAKDKESTIFLYPSDFCLHYLGEFDDNTGMIKPVPPTSVCEAIDFFNE